jgi:putative oxidoreductase
MQITRKISTNWILPLRLIIGFGFAAHGYAKLSRGPANFGRILEGMGVPQPNLVAWITSVFEFTGGASIIAGAFVVPLALPLSLIMLTAMFKIHFQYGFSSVRLKSITATGAEFGPIGYEINLLYVAGLITLALSETPRLSIDYWLKRAYYNTFKEPHEPASPLVHSHRNK